MLQFLYKNVLTLNSTILFALIYIIKNKVYIQTLGAYSIVLYILVILLFTILCLLGTRLLPNDSMEGGIQEVSLASDGYLPSYLGYFFVALSIDKNDWILFGVIFALVYVFTYSSQLLYFNPLFLILGFHFYYVISKEQVKIFVISRKKDIRGVRNLGFDKLKRINNFTFIDEG